MRYWLFINLVGNCMQTRFHVRENRLYKWVHLRKVFRIDCLLRAIFVPLVSGSRVKMRIIPNKFFWGSFIPAWQLYSINSKRSGSENLSNLSAVKVSWMNKKIESRTLCIQTKNVFAMPLLTRDPDTNCRKIALSKQTS